jgi:hypothetical protein
VIVEWIAQALDWPGDCPKHLPQAIALNCQNLAAPAIKAQLVPPPKVLGFEIADLPQQLLSAIAAATVNMAFVVSYRVAGKSRVGV